MNLSRRQFLHHSLRERLVSESDAHGYSVVERLAWLAEHVEEYVDRWLGLLSLEGWSWAEIVEHDLFQVIAIGSDILTIELSRIQPATGLHLKWIEFLGLIGAIRVDDGPERCVLLLDAIRAVRAELRKSKPSSPAG